LDLQVGDTTQWLQATALDKAAKKLLFGKGTEGGVQKQKVAAVAPLNAAADSNLGLAKARANQGVRLFNPA
jgi:hypothetical protein